LDNPCSEVQHISAHSGQDLLASAPLTELIQLMSSPEFTVPAEKVGDTEHKSECNGGHEVISTTFPKTIKEEIQKQGNVPNQFSKAAVMLPAPLKETINAFARSILPKIPDTASNQEEQVCRQEQKSPYLCHEQQDTQPKETNLLEGLVEMVNKAPQQSRVYAQVPGKI